MQIPHPERRDKISIERERTFTMSGGLAGRFPSSLPGLVILLLFLIAPALATEPTVIITGYEVTPAVLMPGDTGTVTFSLSHTAEAASETEQSGITSSGIITSSKTTGVNVFIENVHLEGNGIVVLTDDFDRLGELGPGQSVPVTFVIRAPDKTGLYFPEVWVDVKDGRSTRYPITVNVNTDLSTQKKPAFSISRTLPDGVAPGEMCEAEITLENTGLMRASDIWMTVNPDVESLALTSSGRFYIEHLDPGERSSLILQFATDRNIPIGLNPVRLVLTYRNLDGTTESQTETIAIPVKGLADIAISSVTTDPVRPGPGSSFTLVVRVENTGTDRATSVRATLDSPLPGTKDAFIGSIDKDSDAPAIF
ncbi:MAG: S-layer protein, partial [Methanolinea sp.]|nr:S-layer protein [Methanolinea sp.]